MRRLLMSRLIRIFTVFLINLFFIPIIELLPYLGGCPNLAVCPNKPDFTLTNEFCSMGVATIYANEPRHVISNNVAF